MTERTARALPIVIVVAVFAACSGGASAVPSLAAPSVGDGAATGSVPIEGGASGGPNGYEGSLATSGIYAASWTVDTGQDAEPFNSYGARTLVSDKGTFGNIAVTPDGSVSFGSGAPELSAHGLEYTGTGAKPVLDATGAYVCSFTVDTDLAASDGTKLRISGTMTVHWYPEGLGGISCP